MQFTNIPTWAIPQKADRWTFFETMALLGLENQWIRLSAANQRALLGAAVFGKQEIMVDEFGTVSVRRVTCFGMDSERAEYSPIKVRETVAQNKKLSPGVFGPSYA